MKNTVRELLQDKIHEVSSVEPDKSAHDAMQLMADNHTVDIIWSIF